MWQATRRFLVASGYAAGERKIFAVSYTHNGVKSRDVIGETSRWTHEPVLVILETDGAFLVCSENRGVARGTPFLVGKHWDTRATDFGD